MSNAPVTIHGVQSNVSSMQEVSMLAPRQLAFSDLPVLSVAPEPASGDHGEVFTRRWVVELVLDLVGYSPENDLGTQVLVEPSCGAGAFLVPAVERLIESSRTHGHDLSDLTSAVQAFDLLEANATKARNSVVDLLVAAGLTEGESRTLAATWVTTCDFLLHDHGSLEADFVVGNPPYIRLESIPRSTMDAYRRACLTMRGRADVYVGFIERGLEILAPGGGLGYICADRWMRNQYGADLRQFITSGYAVESIVSMHDVDAFDDTVSAYPAVITLRNRPQGAVSVVDAQPTFAAQASRSLTDWVRDRGSSARTEPEYRATRVDGWFAGRDLWPSGSAAQLAAIADLEKRFPPLEDPQTGTRVGIGVATGCDDVFITRDPELVESERLLPLLHAHDTTAGQPRWSGSYLVNPWDENGLVDLHRYPRLAAYFSEHSTRLRARHVAQKRPTSWYRTIDRVDMSLRDRAKLVLPDMKAASHPVLDTGDFYPHHNLYVIVSDRWDPKVLGGLLLSNIANLFVGAYCVKMRGGTYRFQAQYLRRIRVPEIESVHRAAAKELARAFDERDQQRADHVAAQLYDVRL